MKHHHKKYAIRRWRGRGFTLIELIVILVIFLAIIGLAFHFGMPAGR